MKIVAMASDAKRFFLCTWYQPIHDLGKRRLHSQIHKVRDGLVSVYISTLLTECGYRFSGALLNVPSGIRSSPTLRDSPLDERSDDVIWISTRLPLHEAPHPTTDDSRKRRLRIIDRSESSLEKRILASFKPYFETCCRTRIALSSGVILAGPARAYRVCDFQEFSGGVLTQQGTAESRLRSPYAHRLTVGYLVALPPQEGIGRLIAGFGPAGTETLLFGLLLTTEFRERVCQIFKSAEPRLFLVKFFVPEYIPSPLLAYQSSELGARLLADQALPALCTETR